MSASTTRHISILFGLLVISSSEPLSADTHPRIWLTPALLSTLRAKAGSGDPDWLHVKEHADQLLTRQMPRFTVTAATNSDPVQFTIAEPVPWSGSPASCEASLRSGLVSGRVARSPP